MKFFSPSQWSIAWRVRLGLLIVPLILLGLATFQFLTSRTIVDSYRTILFQATLLLTSQNMMHSINDMEAAKAIYLNEPNRQAWRHYEDAKVSVDRNYKDSLRRATPDSDIARKLRAFYAAHSAWRTTIAEPAMKAARAGRLRTARALSHQGSMAAQRAAFDTLRLAAIQKRAREIEQADQLRRWAEAWRLTGIAITLLLTVFLVSSLVRLVTQPMQEMVEQSHRIEAGDFSPNLTARRDEFGRVIQAMNEMAVAVQRQIDRERLLSRIIATVTRSLDRDTVMETTAREAGLALAASRCIIRLCDNELPGNSHRSEAQQREQFQAAPSLVAFEWCAPGVTPLSTTDAGGVVATRLVLTRQSTVVSPDVREDTNFAQVTYGEIDTWALKNVRALLATPLWSRGTIIGTLTIHQCDRVRHWQPAEIELAETIARQVATALDNAHLFQEARRREEELRLIRDALVQSGEALQQKNQELEEFVYSVSHDLKAPIISMQGYLAALQTDHHAALNDEAQFFIQRAITNSEHLQGLIANLIDLSRIGRVGEGAELFDSQTLVQEVVDELALQAKAKAVSVEVAPNLPIICGEKKQLYQAFVNLIDNAIKYSDAARQEHWIRVECEEKEHEWIFAVRDNGIGIEARHQDKVFNIFQRVGNSKEPGSGIGLSIVKRTAEVHGGRTWVESSGVGEGSTFYFSIAKLGVPQPEVTLLEGKRETLASGCDNNVEAAGTHVAYSSNRGDT